MRIEIGKNAVEAVEQWHKGVAPAHFRCVDGDLYVLVHGTPLGKVRWFDDELYEAQAAVDELLAHFGYTDPTVYLIACHSAVMQLGNRIVRVAKTLGELEVVVDRKDGRYYLLVEPKR